MLARRMTAPLPPGTPFGGKEVAEDAMGCGAVRFLCPLNPHP